MKILTIVALWEFGMGLSLFGYIWLEWEANKEKFVANGWTLRRCTPFEPAYANVLFFIPLIRIFWYLCVGDFLCQIANLKKADHPEIHVRFLNYEVIYSEID